MQKKKVVVVTVVYGERFPLLQQVIDAVLKDDQIIRVIVVDNGCRGIEALDGQSGKIEVIHQEQNIGFSGAIHDGLKRARDIDCDYVFVLDDDSVPETGAVDYFLTNLNLLGNNQKVVLAANRIDVPGNKDVFTRKPLRYAKPNMTIFEVFRFKKMVNAFKFFFKIKPKNDYPFLPIAPVESVVTGGSFVPIEAIRSVPLPDKRFFIYGEDLEFSWNMYKKGYRSYVCARPIIRDIDMTFSEEGGHISGLFKPDTPDFKVYFRMRNAVIISRRHSEQVKSVLVLSIILWFTMLGIYGLFVVGPSKQYWVRLVLITKALYCGYHENFDIPSGMVIPGQNNV